MQLTVLQYIIEKKNHKEACNWKDRGPQGLQYLSWFKLQTRIAEAFLNL